MFLVALRVILQYAHTSRFSQGSFSQCYKCEQTTLLAFVKCIWRCIPTTGRNIQKNAKINERNKTHPTLGEPPQRMEQWNPHNSHNETTLGKVVGMLNWRGNGIAILRTPGLVVRLAKPFKTVATAEHVAASAVAKWWRLWRQKWPAEAEGMFFENLGDSWPLRAPTVDEWIALLHWSRLRSDQTWGGKEQLDGIISFQRPGTPPAFRTLRLGGATSFSGSSAALWFQL